MISRISDHVLYRLLVKIAHYVGPASRQYIKLLFDHLDQSGKADLAACFALSVEEHVLEEACYRAMKNGYSEVSQLAGLIMELTIEE